MSENSSSRVEEEPLVPSDVFDAPVPFADEDLKALRRSWNADRVKGKPDLESLVAYCAGLSTGKTDRIRAQLTQDLGLIDLTLKVDAAITALRSISWARVQELAHSKPKETGDLMPEVAEIWLRLLRSHDALGAESIAPARSSFVRNWLLRLSAPRLATVRGEEPDDEAEPPLISGDLGDDVECRLESARIETEGTLVVSAQFRPKLPDVSHAQALEGCQVFLVLGTANARRDIAEAAVSGGRATWQVDLGGGAETARLKPPPTSALSIRLAKPADPGMERRDRTVMIAPVRARTSGSGNDQVELEIAAAAEGENVSLTIDASPATRRRYGDGTLVLDLSVAGGWQRLGEWGFLEQAVRIENCPGAETPIAQRLRAEILVG